MGGGRIWCRELPGKARRDKARQGVVQRGHGHGRTQHDPYTRAAGGRSLARSLARRWLITPKAHQPLVWSVWIWSLCILCVSCGRKGLPKSARFESYTRYRAVVCALFCCVRFFFLCGRMCQFRSRKCFWYFLVFLPSLLSSRLWLCFVSWEYVSK